ncbi:hypothetical protein TIFTF001_028698 [Ficus carica]|uniref:SWIM-type domain-containing protein n=1 Tax=Ficus carica TaxID=3494 RepID=A0AA88DQ91_FICCA|nr:hypothetical protein TIFTF001_028698 [Ficus carica]
MDEVCVFVKYNGQLEGILRYVGGKMKRILVSVTATYAGLIELVRSVIGIRGLDKTIVMRYTVEPGMPLVRLQCDADVKFYIQLKKNDVHVLSKFSISIDVLDEYAAEAMPPEVGESNHIDVQPSREGGQSDKAIQPVNDNNLIILPPHPLHIASPTLGLDLHTEDGIEKQHQLLNNDLCMDHDDCNAGELNIADATCHSNEKSIATSIGAHSIVNTTRTQSVNVPSSDSLSDSVVVADFTPVTMRINCIFENKKLLQYHLHHDAMSKHYQFKSTAREGSCTNQPEGAMMQSHTKVWRNAACGHDANGSIFPLAFGIIPSESKESWKWFFEKLRDPIGTRESLAIVADRHKGIEYAANIVYPDAAFGICVQHLAANLKTRYKDFKGPLKTYFDGASRSYLVNEHQRHMESIRCRNPDMHRYPVQTDSTKWSRAYFNGRRYAIMTSNIAKSLNSVDWKARLMPVGFLRELLQIWFVERHEEALKITSKLAPKVEKLIHTNFSLGLIVTPQSADQFEYAVTNNTAQTWIVDMSKRTCTCRRFQVDQIPCPHAMAVCNHQRIDPYTYCSNYYTKDYLYACYAPVVHPIGSTENWDVFEEVRSQIVNPPNTKRRPGRPRVRRILS